VGQRNPELIRTVMWLEVWPEDINDLFTVHGSVLQK